MGYYIVQPEVAGDFGDNTVLDFSVEPAVVTRLEYRFSDWLGDAILECTPCFIVTEALASAITDAGLTGVEFDELEVSLSPEGEELIEEPLPRWKWLRFTGKAHQEDLGVDEDFMLVASERALAVLREHGLNNARVTEVTP
ncbi:hypothetical protein NLX83_01710 [Allokutzneria sp. A3M-2-11 16]|uniref:hypothetical protein n=1 Tax=Allokutzneria sp. A3M-2-11 16 TaxID=2962043 RepID=UPI0020B83B8B|nr:hypothetical protein [Allokutzneria sp. A3M-2-11 16]MCP3797965.1 hypothetical protein [Allokutzneria sp. A3M-2-11 16]